MPTPREVAGHLADLLNRVSIETLKDNPRTHLGASQIGKECHRQLWYSFRFFGEEEHDGRQLRLFNRGHHEEPIVKDWLLKMGIKFVEEQRLFSTCEGHYGGSCDGIVELPDGPEFFPFNERPVLWECKTCKDGSDWNKLKSHGVAYCKPEHFAQMCVYCEAFDLDYALYTSVNKNTDEVYFEIVQPDLRLAKQCKQKAETIIKSEFPPNKLAESKTFYKCQYCPFSGICHEGDPIDTRHCRNCKNSEAVADGRWHCRAADDLIPKDQIDKLAVTCEGYEPIV